MQFTYVNPTQIFLGKAKFHQSNKRLLMQTTSLLSTVVVRLNEMAFMTKLLKHLKVHLGSNSAALSQTQPKRH